MDDDRHDLLNRTAQRPFRFGVSAWTGNSRSEWVNKAKKVEDLGYSTLLVGDWACQKSSCWTSRTNFMEASMPFATR